MTVAELIEKLQALDPNTEVAGCDEWGDPEPLPHARKIIHPLSEDECVAFGLRHPAINIIL